MSFDILFQLALRLMSASALDDIKHHEVTTDANKQLTKIVFESTKIRVTVEKLPQVIHMNRTSITNLMMGDAIKFELFNEFNEDRRRTR